MKQIWIFLLLLAGSGATGSPRAAEDSLLKILNRLPADTSRLDMLYKLAYLDPMAPSCAHYLDRLLKETIEQNNTRYQCQALYSYVAYYFNHMDEKNAAPYLEQLFKIALENKYYDLYFRAKRAEITLCILKRRIEYSITEAEEMYSFACKLNNAQGMSYARLCKMTACMMTARNEEGLKAGFEAYRLLPVATPLKIRKEFLQEIALACSAVQHPHQPDYLKEYRKVLDRLSQEKDKRHNYKGSYLLLESLYAGYYLKKGDLNKARDYLKAMDKYFSPTTFIQSRGLYYYTYAYYYRITGQYEKSLAFSDSVISFLSPVSDNGGLNYAIEKASVLAEAGRPAEAVLLFRDILARKETFYRQLSSSQIKELNDMHHLDSLLLKKEQYKATIRYVGLSLIALTLLILLPFTFRICCIRKKLKKEEEEIRRMSLIAEEANKVKSRFLSDMSYNIRIPLTNVLGFSRIMTENPEQMNDTEWEQYSGIIQTNATELIQMVNDVLDLSRLEAGKTKWQIQDYDIIPLCSDVINLVIHKSGNKIQAGFRTSIESQSLQTDISRFTQLLLSTLLWPDLPEKKRKVSLSLQRDVSKKLLIFRIGNSPLADPALQTQKTEIRHNINRLTIAYFGGTYAVETSTAEGPVVTFTYPCPE